MTAAFGGQALTAAVTFLVGNPDPAHCAVTYTPRTLVADGVSISLFSVTFHDATNNAVPGAPITFSSSNPCDVLSHPTTATDVNGQGNTTIASTIAEVKTVTMNNAYAFGTASITFIPGPPALAHSTFTASPTSVTANNSSQSALKLSVADAFNNTIANANVTFSASGSGGIIANRFMATDTNGKAQTSIRAAYTGAHTLTAKVAPISLTAAITFSASACSPPSVQAFPEVPVILTGPNPTGVVARDFNGDGVIDMAVSNGGGNSITLALGSGGGFFQAPYALAAGTGPSSIGSADLTGDGKLDLVVADAGDANTLLYAGVGDGSFQAPRAFNSTPTTNLPLGDMNGDGLVDVVTVYAGGNAITVRLTSTGGALGAAMSYATDSQPSDVALGDLNGDGVLDAVVADANSTNVDVFIGAGGGALNTATKYPATWTNASIQTGDFNGDSLPDVVVGANGNTRFDVFVNDGHGALSATSSVSLIYAPTDVASGDFNGDGLVDVVMICSGGSAMALGKGDGTFQSPLYADLSAQMSGLTTSDLDGDASLDVLALNSQSGHAIVMLGTGTGGLKLSVSRSLPGYSSTGAALVDFDGDGKQDLLFTNFFGVNINYALGNGDGTFATPAAALTLPNRPSGIAAADLNRDGKVDMFSANGNVLSASLGNGSGTFAAPINSSLGTTCAGTAAISAQFTADTYLDIALICPLMLQIYILPGNGNGSFAAPNAYVTGLTNSLGGSVAAADFNADSKTDVIVVEASSPKTVMFPGNGDGTLSIGASTQTFVASNNLQAVAAGDINVDGKPDAVVADSIGKAYLYLNNSNATNPLTFSTSTACNLTNVNAIAIGDVDGNGLPDIVVGGAGAFCVIHNLGATITYPSTQDTASVSIADLNGDGLADILTSASNSGQGPGVWCTPHILSGCRQ